MPRKKGAGPRLRDQVRQAGKALDRVLDHLMAADVIAKGGVIDGGGKMVPSGIDLEHPEQEGHPVLNQYLPLLVPTIGGLKEALQTLVTKL